MGLQLLVVYSIMKAVKSHPHGCCSKLIWGVVTVVCNIDEVAFLLAGRWYLPVIQDPMMYFSISFSLVLVGSDVYCNTVTSYCVVFS